MKQEIYAVSPSEKFYQLNLVFGQLTSGLNSSEILVLVFIWMRTSWWGKDKEFIKLKHFQDGIPGTILGLPLCRATIVKSLNSLIKKDIILKKSTPYGNWYGIIWDKKDNVIMLKTPKNSKNCRNTSLKQPKNTPKEGSNKYTGGSNGYTSYKNENNNYEHKENNTGSDLPEMYGKEDRFKDLNESITKASSIALVKRNKKLDTAAKREFLADLDLLWSKAVKKAFPEVPLAAWSKKSFAMVKHFRNAYQKESNSPVWPFFECCVTNWSRIGMLQFGWMKKVTYPEYPNIEFLIQFKKYFIQAFADEQFHERQLGLTEREREIKKFMRYGYTLQQAEAEIERQMDKFKPVEKERARANKAELDARHAIQLKEQAERDLRKVQIQRDKEFQAREKLNRGSTEEPKLKKNPNTKYDKDGFAIFEGKHLHELDD